MFERKTLALIEGKAAKGDGPGTVEGYGSVFGGVDSYGDRIAPGAYADTLASFLKDGFIAWGHEWSTPVATPTQAHEDKTGLYVVGQFHTHAEAQRARTITAERLERGKTMGLSIGYEAEKWETITVDEPYLTMWGEWTDKVRLLTKIKLFEVSLVTVPADSAARVEGAKQMAYGDEAAAALAAVRGFVLRSKSLADLRTKEGRVLSEANRAKLQTVLDALAALGTVQTEVADLLAATERVPDGDDEKAVALNPIFQRAAARQRELALLMGA